MQRMTCSEKAQEQASSSLLTTKAKLGFSEPHRSERGSSLNEMADPAQHEIYIHLAKQLALSPIFCAKSPAEQLEQMRQSLQGLPAMPLIEILGGYGAISYEQVRGAMARHRSFFLSLPITRWGPVQFPPADPPIPP